MSLSIKMNENIKKPNVLFWLDGQLIHFGIAKFLKEKFDCNLSAIVHVHENRKNFFLEQKLTKFEKLWFYRDHIKPSEKPDLEYLSLLEKKYNIPLWLIAYSERFFYGFTKYKKLSQNEILSILEQELRFFEMVLEKSKPDFVVLRFTDFHHIHLFFRLCRSKNIKTFVLVPTRLGFQTIVAESPDPIMPAVKIDLSKNNIDLSKLSKYGSDYGTQSKTDNTKYRSDQILKLKSFYKFFFVFNNKKFTEYYGNFEKTRFNVIKIELKLLFLSKFRKSFIDKHLEKTIQKNRPYIYFPLHAEPERAISIPAPYYMNQISVIENIAKSIPINYTLYVKEHPFMKANSWRSTDFYKKILDMPNVKLFHPDISPNEIMKNSDLVITISGTAGWESLFYEKPSIVFSDTFYSNLSCVFRAKGFEDLSELILHALNQKPNANEIKKFIDQINDIGIVYDDKAMLYDAYNKFSYGGFMSDAEISETTMFDFLKKYQSQFELIVDKHIEKFNQNDF